MIVPVKKKKKAKKPVKHQEPDTSKLGLGQGAPSQPPSAQAPKSPASPTNASSTQDRPAERPKSPERGNDTTESPRTEETTAWAANDDDNQGQSQNHNPGYQLPDSDEFKNVWD